MRIPLSAPDISEEEIQAVTDVLRTPTLSLGPKLEEFEHAIARYVGASNAIAVSSGTSGLHLCIRALHISEGDEVIVPSFAFIAVANAVRYERAMPVFVDIEPETLNLDPSQIEAAITARTKAIIVVHTFGLPANLEAILDIARRHRLYVIEDACEAIGAEYRRQKVGTIGDVGVFAFYPNKQITTGEGGVIVTQNTELARSIRTLRNQGRDGSENWFQHSELGYNYRISEINCALGVEQLRRIESILARRKEIAEQYSRMLEDHRGLKLPLLTLTSGRISWFVFVIQLGMQFTRLDRDQIVRELNLRGIGAGRYFAPIHLQPIYESRSASRILPVTERVASRTVALPFFNRIEAWQVEEVCLALIELMRSAQGLRDQPHEACELHAPITESTN